jgi:hypothetical protein
MDFLEKVLIRERGVFWDELYQLKEELDQIIDIEKQIFENAKSFIETLENNLREKANNIDGLDKVPKNEEEEDQAQFYYHLFGMEEDNIHLIFQNQLRSRVLSIFSILEKKLYQLCKLIEKEFNFSVKLKHLKGNDTLNGFWTYLTFVFKFDKNEIEKLYTPIVTKKYLRNKIAHGKNIDQNNLRNQRSQKGLVIYEHRGEGYFRIENSYVYQLIEELDLFFVQLIKSVDRRYIEIKGFDKDKLLQIDNEELR